MLELASLIRDVPDFPKKGILFKDITTLLKHPAAFKQSIDLLTDLVRGLDPGVVIGMESRGFIFAAPIAYQLDAGFVPVSGANEDTPFRRLRRFCQAFPHLPAGGPSHKTRTRDDPRLGWPRGVQARELRQAKGEKRSERKLGQDGLFKVGKPSCPQAGCLLEASRRISKA